MNRIDEIFLSLKKMTPSSYTLLRNSSLSFIGEIWLDFSLYPSLIIWDQKQEMTRKFYMDKEIEENYDVENKKGIVYNGIVQQFGKGM